MNERDAMNPNQRFCELAGICWHEYDPDYDVWCRKCGDYVGEGNSDFAAEPWRVLGVMREREDWLEFCERIGIVIRTSPDKIRFFIEDKYILDRTGKLRDKAIRWMEERR